MKKIKLSCLVTNYNQVTWIEEAVESILNQNLDYSYEILIGDDGSNDGSVERLKAKYGQIPHIRLFVQERDEGVKEFSNWRHSRLIFRLLDEAQGEFLSILDGDDYFCDMNHFKQKIEILEKEENKECVACYGNMYNLSNGDLQLDAIAAPYPEGKCRWLKKRKYMHLATAVIRRKALEDVPRNIYYEAFADVGVTTWLAHKGIFYYVQTPCLAHRVLPNSIWNSTSQELNALRCIMLCDLSHRACGGGMREYKRFKNSFSLLYFNKKLVKNINYEMWNAFTTKYHAKIANMLLNRDTLKLTEKMYLFVFCLRLGALWTVLQGYAIGIRQICSPKISLKQKRILMKNWWTRITEQ